MNWAFVYIPILTGIIGWGLGVIMAAPARDKFHYALRAFVVLFGLFTGFWGLVFLNHLAAYLIKRDKWQQAKKLMDYMPTV